MSKLTIGKSELPDIIVGDWMTRVDGVWRHSWLDEIKGEVDPLAMIHGLWMVHSILDRTEDFVTFEALLVGGAPKEMLPIAAGDVRPLD